jgi:alkanesulfonate monooxygenase SsuD/methylene tetrahydromethanopterin reductase-like flavin-dependent oxidoreductase (luciferase family)
MIKFGGFLENPINHELLAKTTLELEKAGFHSVWLEDHLVISPGLPNDYKKAHKRIPLSLLAPSMLECWTTLSWLAGKTSRIRLGTLVTCNLFRYPSVLAKMASTFDIFSEGRLELGLGAGYWKPEFEMYGIPLPDHVTRMERLAEAVQIINSMWTKEVTDFSGKYYTVKGALNNPKPVQKPHPPILIGGSGQRLMKCAAQFADNWNFPVQPTLTPEEYGPVAATFDEYCRQVGRSPKEVVKSMMFRCIIDKKIDRVREKVKRLKPDWESLDVFMKRLIGTPQQCIEKLNAFKEKGLEYCIIHFEDATDFESMELFAEEVIPALK